MKLELTWELEIVAVLLQGCLAEWDKEPPAEQKKEARKHVKRILKLTLKADYEMRKLRAEKSELLEEKTLSKTNSYCQPTLMDLLKSS